MGYPNINKRYMLHVSYSPMLQYNLTGNADAMPATHCHKPLSHFILICIQRVIGHCINNPPDIIRSYTICFFSIECQSPTILHKIFSLHKNQYQRLADPEPKLYQGVIIYVNLIDYVPNTRGE